VDRGEGRVVDAVGGFRGRGPMPFRLNSASTSGGLRRSPRVNEAASSADDCAYWVSVMVRIGLGREVGAVSYGLVSRLLGGAGTVQVGSGSA
jgi:hypothetical protein